MFIILILILIIFIFFLSLVSLIWGGGGVAKKVYYGQCKIDEYGATCTCT